MDRVPNASFRALWQELSRQRIWVLYVSRVVLFAGTFCMIPHLQTEFTDYFVKQHTSENLDCTGVKYHRDGDDDDTPQACIDAHNDVLLWTAGRTVVTAFTVSLMFNPAVGTWSDMYGRKPFLIYSSLAQGLLVSVVLLYTLIEFPLYWYYPAHVIAVPFNAQSIYIAYAADKISEENLILSFALLVLTLPIGIVMGTGLAMGVVGSLRAATILGLSLCLVATMMQLLFLPESLSVDLQYKARESVAERRASTTLRSSLSFWWTSCSNSMKIVWRTPLFRKLTLTMFAVGFVAEEYTEFRVQYLQEVLGFGTSEQSTMMMIMGVSGLLFMTVGVWLVRPVLKLTDKQIMILGTTMVTISVLLLATVQSTWMAYLSTGLVSSWMLIAMAVSTIKASNVAVEMQGAVQGALTAVMMTGMGVGPLIFFALYYIFRHGSLYLPGAPFYFASFLMFITVCMSISLDMPSSRDQKTVTIATDEATAKTADDEEAPLLSHPVV